MKEQLLHWLSSFPPEAATFLLAMTPIGEVRVSVPIGILTYKLPIEEVILLSLAGNILAGAIVMLILLPVINFLIKHWEFLGRLWRRYIYRLETKNKDGFRKWGSLILILFVAIPLPMTGIYSGAVAASIFRIPFFKAISLLSTGSLIATLLVLAISVVFS